MNVMALWRAARNYYLANRDVRHALRSSDGGGFMREALAHAIGPQPECLKEIEKRRWQLLNDRSPIEFLNFGVGASASKPSEGRAIQLPISEAARASKPLVWGRLLYAITRQVKPGEVLEMGTCVGISGSYIAMALKANGTGRLISMEGNPSSAKIAEQSFRALNVSEAVSIVVGPFQSTLTGVLKEHGPFDLVFIDGHHQRDPTIEYFRQIRPHLSERSIVVFDDIRWSDGMLEAWNEIRAMPNLEAIDMGAIGSVRLSKST